MGWVSYRPLEVTGLHGKLRGSRWSALTLHLTDVRIYILRSVLARVLAHICHKLSWTFICSLRLPFHCYHCPSRNRHQCPRSPPRCHPPRQNELSLVGNLQL